MKMSNKTGYAIRTVVDLAMHAGHSHVPAADIAARQHIPRKYLEQILTALRVAGVVGSVRGAQGGYFLTTDSRKLHLDDIVRVTEPGLFPSEDNGKSYLDRLWNDISRCVEKKLSGLTVDDFCRAAQEEDDSEAVSYII